MYRTIYPETTSKASSWYNKNQLLSRKKALEKCQCMRLQYRHHWGWFKKVVGVFLVFLSISILIWNEKRAVDNSRSYHEGLSAIKTVSSSMKIHPENEGKLVHVFGYLRIAEPMEDLTYGVSIYAVKLKRRVQMYQWVEEKTSPLNDFEPASGSIRYRQHWKDKLIDSSTFEVSKGHENPKSLPLQSEIRVNPHIYLGAYKLGLEFKDKFNNFIPFTSGERPESPELKMHMGLYYLASDIWNPSIGDTRIQFSFAGPANAYVSIIAMQRGGELRPFITESGAVLDFLHEGKRHHLDIFNKEHSTVAVESWMYRMAAYVVAISGTFMTSWIIALINRRNSVVKNLMAMGPQKFSIVTAGFICLTIIGCIWFSHKPIFSVLLVIFACALVLYYALTGPDVPSSSKISLPQYSRVY